MFGEEMNEFSLFEQKEKVPEIKVSESNGMQTISARELYERLGITDRFSRWFDSLLKYGFEENVDFTSVKTSTLVNNGAERELTDYAITIEMAKQICMLQRSDKGKLYREYFIKIEKAWNTPEVVMARALQVANRMLEDIQKKLTVAEAKNALLMHTKKTYTASEIAKEVGLPSAQKLNILLEKKGVQFYRNNTWIPYAKYADKGYFEIKQGISDSGYSFYNSHITQKGREFILTLFQEA